MGTSPADVYYGDVPGFTSYTATPQNTIIGDAFDAIQNVPGISQVVGIGSEILDAAANQQFKSTYGATPEEFLASGTTMEQLQLMVAYGPLDELYNFSDNPRGTSQIVGLLSGLPGTYSTGANNLINAYGTPIDPTDKSTVESVLNDVIAKDFDDPDISIESMKRQLKLKSK